MMKYMSVQTKALIGLFILVVGQLSLPAQNKRLISGTVIDAATKEPLPYVTVSLKKQLVGIVTNEEGKFDLYFPKEVVNDTLLVNYLGYKHFSADIATLKQPLTIALEETVVQLEEIVVRPLSPENYIQIAMRKIKENYPKDPFQTEAYYREKVLENKKLVKCDEGVFKTFYLSYIDTVKPDHQLLLFRRAENHEAIAFMSKEVKKKQENDTSGNQKINLDLGETFGGPSGILKRGDISKKPNAYLDSLQFKKYKYSFAKSSSYNSSELMVIDFETRGKVNHVRESGKIYIDLNTQAIVRVECKGDFIIPAIIKPVLFVFNIRIKNPKYEKNSEFQQVNGKWYPKTIQNNIDLKLINWHWFRKNDRSNFEIEQFFAVNELQTDNISAIVAEKRFDTKKEIDKQIYNDVGITWEELNIIKK